MIEYSINLDKTSIVGTFMSSLIKDVVSFFGNQRKTAEALDITQPTVNHMIATGKVSADIALRIQKQTNNHFLALDLRPSLREHFSNIQVL